MVAGMYIFACELTTGDLQLKNVVQLMWKLSDDMQGEIE
jgi:hypothetical protein